jgi:hypothetical protein
MVVIDIHEASEREGPALTAGEATLRDLGAWQAFLGPLKARGVQAVDGWDIGSNQSMPNGCAILSGLA